MVFYLSPSFIQMIRFYNIQDQSFVTDENQEIIEVTEQFAYEYYLTYFSNDKNVALLKWN